VKIGKFGVWYSTEFALILMLVALLSRKPWIMLVGVVILGIVGPYMARKKDSQAREAHS
jgi:hypothetical protein